MVDSIAVNSPSGQTGSSRDQSPVFNLPRMAEDAGDRDTLARMRSAKRIKLSPRSDFYGEDAGEDAIIARPKLIGRDYVGESQSLMQKIKQARDFSTISTEASAHSPAETVIEHPSNPVDVTNVERGRADANRLGLPEAGSSNSSATGSSINSRSGSAYREQAEALMAQIRGDVKSQKRLFSGDTDTTTFTAPFESSVDTIQTRLTQRTGEDPARDGSLRHQRVVSSNSTGSTRSKPRNSPRRVSNPISKVSSSRTISNLADGVADMNLRNSRNTAIVVTITPPTTILHPSEAAALATRAPAAYPAYSIRSATNDDLNRFVSSSTTASGTTITSGTAASSFVKHAGPAQIRTIAPQDLPTLPDKVMSKIEEVSEVDEEEAELTSFSFDDPTAGIVPVMTGVETEASDCGDYDESTDSADEQENAVVPNEVSGDGFETEDELRPTEASLAEAESDLRYSIESLSIVAVVRRSTGPAQASTPRVRSVLKSATATPVSVMKDSSRHRTPANKHRHRRSVSFSDGKRDGPIRGLSRTMEDSLSLASSSGASENNTIRDAGHATPGFVPSARSKRIADLVENLESDSAHDRLVQVITDVQPFEPHWEELSHIDLSEKKIESVARLKEFLPHLDSLSFGVPSSVRTLSVSSNRFACFSESRHLSDPPTPVTSVSPRCLPLVTCSIWRTSTSARMISTHCADEAGNAEPKPKSPRYISGLALLPSLIALNVDSNDLTRLEFTASMPKLRILRASHNRLQELDVGLTMNLRTLYADGNILGGGGEEGRARGGPSNGRAGIEGGKLKSLDRLAKLENLSLRNQSGGALALRPRDIRDVKRLYLSGNPLHTSFFSTSTTPFYNLLYLEVAGCRLSSLPPTISSLFPNLRVLNLNYNFLDEADVCALLGGINAPAGGSNSAGYSNGLGRLRKLMIVGSRVRSMKKVVGLLSRLREVELLDFRMNPCTLGWYLPLLVKDIPGALQPSKTSSSSFEPATSNSNGAESRPRDTWQELDTKFRRDLPMTPTSRACHASLWRYKDVGRRRGYGEGEEEGYGCSEGDWGEEARWRDWGRGGKGLVPVGAGRTTDASRSGAGAKAQDVDENRVYGIRDTKI
ncbi:sin component scaffold protein [Salix suchowensis]|nr:sin component scaffold protein [Salix suchowensis]